MTEAPAAPLDPEMLGVPLSVYAAVRGFTAEGVPLAESLAHAAIAPEAWPAVEAAWSARLAESAHDDLSLITACDEHRFRAEAHVERPLPPLDEELRAWLDFFRAFTAAADPLAFLAEHRLVEADLFRLLALWQARSAARRCRPARRFSAALDSGHRRQVSRLNQSWLACARKAIRPRCSTACS